MCGSTPMLDRPVMPVMSATRGLAPTRPCVAWTSSETNTVRPKPLGARARNGRHATAIPAANPPANHTRPRRASRHRAHATRAGMTAQILIAAAKPKQAPAQNVPPARPAVLAADPVAVEQEHRSQQAEQVQPRLEEQRRRRGRHGRVDRVDAAGQSGGQRAPVPDEQPGQDHVGRVRAHGEHPGRRQGPRAAELLAAERGGHHQQHGARRLDRREVPVRDHPVDQAQGVADVHPVVVLGESGQVTRPGQLEDPQAEAEQGGHRDDRARAPRPGRGGGRAHTDGAGTGCAGRRRHSHAQPAFPRLSPPWQGPAPTCHLTDQPRARFAHPRSGLLADGSGSRSS